MEILITGGAGYIGSHTAVACIEAGFKVSILDNFCTGSEENLNRIFEVTGETPATYNCNVGDYELVKAICSKRKFEAVLHFAAYKSAAESLQDPTKYYDNNIGNGLRFLRAITEANCKRVIFSSSAAVYGDGVGEFRETDCLGGSSPYALSKRIYEEILQSMSACNSSLSMVCLRYFNPIGAHRSGLLGEESNGSAGNLIPEIMKAASRPDHEFKIYGDDYDTADGTGVRDYIHIMDVADAHVAALQYASLNDGYKVWNIGTGSGTSVLAMVHRFEKITGKHLNFTIVPRRPGDVAAAVAVVDKIYEDLGWRCQFGVDDMIRSAWEWHIYHKNN